MILTDEVIVSPTSVVEGDEFIIYIVMPVIGDWFGGILDNVNYTEEYISWKNTG